MSFGLISDIILEEMKLNLFSAFCDRPANARFAYQEEDEYIELLLRQHWFTNIDWILTAILAAFAPFLFPFVDPYLKSLNLTIPLDIKFALVILWYMLVLAYVIEKLLYWYFNIYIVTNRHIIDIDFQNLLNRYTTEVRLEDVQSPRARIKGIMGSLFNFGDVKIETAAKTQVIDFLSVPKPDLVVDRIQDLHEEINKRREGHLSTS